MKTFKSFLLVDHFKTKRILELEFNRDFNIDFEKDPSKRFWASKDGKTFMEQIKSGCDDFHNSDDFLPAQRIIIKAENEELAENVKDLLFIASNMVYPNPNQSPDTGFLIEDSREEEDTLAYHEQPLCSYFKKVDNPVLAFKIVLKCLSNKNLTYALVKYGFSVRLDSFTPHSASPRFGQIFDNYFTDYQYHVNAAYAINSAYSVLEELQLEIRSSSSKPTYNADKTDFNEQVRSDLDKRLSPIGLSSSDRFDWILRGEITLLQREFDPNFGVRNFPDSPTVLDERIELIEAIQRARLIRNFITAHKFKDVTEFISPYDVFNIQTLVRKAFFHKIDLWNELIKKSS